MPIFSKLEIKDKLNTISFEYPDRISLPEAEKLQKEAGYNSCGYGIYSFSQYCNKTYWECWKTCD